MGRIMAVDYGQKRVGLAVTDELKIIATALETVHTKDIFSFLAEYFKKEQVECVVIGEPRQMNNTASDAVRFINPFVKKFKKTFYQIRVERFDERFTSKIAQQSILDAGLKKKDRRDKTIVDRVSAVLILQSYLDSMQYKSNIQE